MDGMEYMKKTFLGKTVVQFLGSYGDGANRISCVLDINPHGMVLECTKLGYKDTSVKVGTVTFWPWHRVGELALRETTDK